MITLSTFDQKKNKKSGSPEEIAKEFLSTNDQANRMSNAFASLKSQQNSQEETAEEFYSENDQASRMSNAFTSLECLIRLHH